MKGEIIPITYDSSTLNAFCARPEKGPGILVLHAWWGLTGFIQKFCIRLADEGFVTLAPDLYDGHIASTIDQAKTLRSTKYGKGAVKKINGSLDFLLSSKGLTGGKVGVIGFSIGGHFALELSSIRREVKAVVTFYGTSKAEQGKSGAAFLGHFAERDDYVSSSTVQSLKRALENAGKVVIFHTYPKTRHWFFEADRKDAYNADAASLAWRRTQEFLGARLME